MPACRCRCLSPRRLRPSSVFFFFNAPATTEIYTLSLHDALPILTFTLDQQHGQQHTIGRFRLSVTTDRKSGSAGMPRPISYAVFCLKKKQEKTRNHTDPAHTAGRTTSAHNRYAR